MRITVKEESNGDYNADVIFRTSAEECIPQLKEVSLILDKIKGVKALEDSDFVVYIKKVKALLENCVEWYNKQK